jgi:hypothetical protein
VGRRPQYFSSKETQFGDRHRKRRQPDMREDIRVVLIRFREAFIIRISKSETIALRRPSSAKADPSGPRKGHPQFLTAWIQGSISEKLTKFIVNDQQHSASHCVKSAHTFL